MTRDVVLLDAGGTLFTERETRDEIYTRVLRGRGLIVREDVVARLREVLHAELTDEVAGHVRYTEGWFGVFMQRLLDALASTADAESVRLEVAEHFTRPESFVVFADVHPALEALLERGVRLGVVSNWSDRLPALLDALGLARCFEVVVVSAQVGHTKPERGIFDHALARLDVAPERVLHVGDHPVNDLAGARRAGLAGLLLDRAAGGRGRDPAVIASLAELPGRLEI